MVNPDAMTHTDVPAFPREFAPGTFWFTSCLNITVNGAALHNHNSCFLVIGTGATLLIDTAPPFGWTDLRAQLAKVLRGRPLDYIFPTHPEAPHMGNLPRLLAEYPDARVVGDVRNYELYLPGSTDRLRQMGVGERIDLGGRSFVAVPAAVHDLPNTLWGYDTGSRILFVSDGYPYTHDHKEGECAMTSTELAQQPVPEDTHVVIQGALGWTHYVDAEITIAALDAVLDRYPPDIIAPAHGGVITNPREITEVFKAGLRHANGARA